MQQETTKLRETWLMHATSFLIDHMVACGLPPITVRVSCGWPSRGGMGTRMAVIGQCFAPQMCRDGIQQIFISPRLEDSIQVLGTLLHELVHAADRCQHGHKKEFSQAARQVGLAGPPTATTVGPTLYPILERFVASAGPYPHVAIRPVVAEKKAGSRLRLYECECDPPVKVRVASNEFQARCLRCGCAFGRMESF